MVTRDKKQVAESTTSESFMGPRLREGAFIGVSAVCLYLLLALATYSTTDPGWSASGSGGSISNLGGPTGAWLADVFFSLVGYAAYLFPILLAYRALILLLERNNPNGFDWVTFGIRALGLVLVMIAGTALAAMNDGGGSALPQGTGGILGQSIGGAFTMAFSEVGSRLIRPAFIQRRGLHRPVHAVARTDGLGGIGELQYANAELRPFGRQLFSIRVAAIRRRAGMP